MSRRFASPGGVRARPVTVRALPPRPGSEDPGLLRRVPAILYTADAGGSGVWHYVSPQIEGILGYSPQEWCADPELWAQRLHPDDRERLLTYEESVVGGAATTAPIEYRLLARSGRVVWVRDDALLLTDNDGASRWHGVMSDITERKEAETELERRAAQQAAVARLGEHALEGASTSELMNEAVHAAAELLEIDIATVLEGLADGESFRRRAAHGLPESALASGVPGGRGSLAGYTVRNGGAVVVNDWELEDRFRRSPTLTAAGVRSGLAVAIAGRQAPFGVLGLHSRSPREFKAGDLDFAQALANVLGTAFERQATEDDIRHRALHDPLTGLPNRVLFLDRLQLAITRLHRRRHRSAVLLLDLDRFKLIIDSLGHQVGDELLAAAAPRLTRAVHAGDTVARFGGDEFAILLDEITGEHEAVEMAQRIASAFTPPFVLAGEEHFLTVSVGIALAEGGKPAEDVVRDADAAMNRAKERGRAGYELFDEDLRARAVSRLQVENDLRRALERDELRLDYQPVVSLLDLSIVSVEALIRWEHPLRGRISPADFIPVAEESGLIGPIGRWVLDQACRQAARWRRDCPGARLSMFVNLSAVQIADHGLAETVGAALSAHAVDPACLMLEITESVMLADLDSLSERLAALKRIGVRLMLDDFGTGYSSLAYLTRLPLDALKVDRSFVGGLGTEPSDTAITEAIVAMSHALSLDVVAEGAETRLQVAELTRLGCDLVQGFYFSCPVSAAEITQMLVRGPAWLGRSDRDQATRVARG